MASVLDLVKHYQTAIEKYSHDEQKVLKCIDKLFSLGVTVQHLQDTGVGRTVNALRKEPGDVGQAARSLVYKWKLMVAAEESDPEDHNNDTSTYNGHGSGKDSDDSVQRSQNNSDQYEKSNSTGRPKDQKDVNGSHSGNKRRYHSSEEEETQKRRKHSSSSGEDYDGRSQSRSKMDESASDSYGDSDNSQSDDSESELSESSQEEIKIKKEIKTEPVESPKSSSKHSSHRENVHAKSSSSSKRHHSDTQSKHDSSQSKVGQTSSEKNSTKEKHHSSDRHINSSSEKHSGHRSDKQGSHSSDKHTSHSSEKYSSHYTDKHGSHSSDKHKNSKEKEPSSEKKHKIENKSDSEKNHKESKSSKHTSSSASDKHKSSSSHKADNVKEKSSSDKNSKSDKHKSSSYTHSSEKDKHKGSSEKEVSKHRSKESTSNGSSVEKHSSSSKDKSKDKGCSSKDKPSSEKKHSSSSEQKSASSTEHRSSSSSSKMNLEKISEKSEKSGHKSSSSSHKSSLKSNSNSKKDDVPKKKINEGADSDDGIDCGSGASFAEALGMISPAKPKKKPGTSQLKDSSSPNSDLSPAALLAPSAKLAPLPAIEISSLPEISPNYKPRPPPRPLPHFSDEDAMNVVISSKNQRTKVYSGNKVIGKVPTLYELCVNVLQEHIDALEYTGGVPYEILKPVVDKATPNQLYMLEHYNNYLMDDTDHLWKNFCHKNFRTKQRQEMETWREMYARCQEEQEHRLKSLTTNIRIAQEAKKAPIKQTKMAYVDSFAKPPRNVAKKQAAHGTARMATGSPAARVAALAAAPNVLRGGTGARALAAPSSTASSLNKPKRAPLMAKALQAMRGRKR